MMEGQSEGTRSASPSDPQVKVSSESHEVLDGIRKQLSKEFERLAPEQGITPVRGKRGNFPTLGDAVDCVLSSWAELGKEQQDIHIRGCAQDIITWWKREASGASASAQAGG